MGRPSVHQIPGRTARCRHDHASHIRGRRQSTTKRPRFGSRHSDNVAFPLPKSVRIQRSDEVVRTPARIIHLTESRYDRAVELAGGAPDSQVSVHPLGTDHLPGLRKRDRSSTPRWLRGRLSGAVRSTAAEKTVRCSLEREFGQEIPVLPLDDRSRDRLCTVSSRLILIDLGCSC